MSYRCLGLSASLPSPASSPSAMGGGEGVENTKHSWSPFSCDSCKYTRGSGAEDPGISVLMYLPQPSLNPRGRRTRAALGPASQFY